MLDQLTFDFDNSASGFIGKVGSYYWATTGWDSCNVGQNIASNVAFGAFFRFDTSSIPDHAQITKVQFRVRGYRTAQSGEPGTYDIYFSIGDIIGGSLDGTAAEWNAGTHMISLDARPADRTTLELDADGNDPLPLVDVQGDTDIKILDHGVQGGGDAQWWAFFNKSTTERCRLYVYFTLPSATLTGKGSLTCAAMVTSSGTAILTGIGTLTCAAMVTSSGTAILTGKGSLSCAASVTYSGTATLTGIGTLSCSAMVTVRGTATLTGVGTLSCAATVINLNVMAQHAATRSISGSHSSSVAVSSVHSASVSCDPEDAGERGARRITDE